MDFKVVDWMIGENVIDAGFIVRFMIVMFIFCCLSSMVRSLTKGVR